MTVAQPRGDVETDGGQLREASTADIAGRRQRLRIRYAKRGRMRFASHRDLARIIERGLRRARIPVAYSEGYAPHPKISYVGAAPTIAASEAEYLEIQLAAPREPDQVRHALDRALPDGVDVIEVVEARGAPLDVAASEWLIQLDGVAPDEARRAVAAFLATPHIEVERVTKRGLRRFDTRGPVVTLELDQRVEATSSPGCAILRMVVQHTEPAVRPDDVLTALRQVAALVPPSPPRVTRLAQGPLDPVTGGIGDPFAPDRGPGSRESRGDSPCDQVRSAGRDARGPGLADMRRADDGDEAVDRLAAPRSAPSGVATHP